MIRTILLFFFMLISIKAFAGTADLFHYDVSKVKKALVNAEVLDRLVSSNHLSFDQLSQDNPVLKGFVVETNSMLMQNDSALGIPSFCWGFCLGVIGILIVYLVTENTDETKKALWGCIISNLVPLIIYGVLLVAGVAASATYDY